MGNKKSKGATEAAPAMVAVPMVCARSGCQHDAALGIAYVAPGAPPLVGYVKWRVKSVCIACFRLVIADQHSLESSMPCQSQAGGICGMMTRLAVAIWSVPRQNWICLPMCGMHADELAEAARPVAILKMMPAPPRPAKNTSP